MALLSHVTVVIRRRQARTTFWSMTAFMLEFSQVHYVFSFDLVNLVSLVYSINLVHLVNEYFHLVMYLVMNLVNVVNLVILQI